MKDQQHIANYTNPSFPFTPSQIHYVFLSNPKDSIKSLGVEFLVEMALVFRACNEDEVNDHKIRGLPLLIAKSDFGRAFRYLFFNCKSFYDIYYTSFHNEAKSLYLLCDVIGLGEDTGKTFEGVPQRFPNKFEAAKALINWVTLYRDGQPYEGEYNTKEQKDQSQDSGEEI